MKKRLDEHIASLEKDITRTQAQNLILAGRVKVDGVVVRQKSAQVNFSDIIEIDNAIRYVSRGGNKLSFALSNFNISVDNYTCLDIGASTGGFTDCLLQNGARLVYALDVGHNQLAYTLRKDSRVTVMEKTNIKNIGRNMFIPPPNIIVSDVSFISITKFAHIIKEHFFDIECWISLIKPQFESKRGEVGKGGIVKDDELRQKIFDSTVRGVEESGFFMEGSCLSPIKGAKGNIEYFALFRLKPSV